VTARQLLAVAVEPGVVGSKATFTFEVAYSPVSSLRIDVPAAVAAIARLPVNAGFTKSLLDPQPEDVAEGDVAMEFRGEGELLGQLLIPLTWEEVVPELAVGESGEYPLPVLTPRGVDRAWGQILISKAETLDIRPASGLSGLRPIDPQHDLMPGAAGADAARAFEFTDAWNLTVTATRYELEEVKRASIERAVVRMVVTRSDPAHPVSYVNLDGVNSDGPSANLVMPVSAVAANPSAVYLADARGVLQLLATSAASGQTWTELRPFMVPGAVPVMPG
jgi:hypothetical protein